MPLALKPSEKIRRAQALVEERRGMIEPPMGQAHGRWKVKVRSRLTRCCAQLMRAGPSDRGDGTGKTMIFKQTWEWVLGVSPHTGQPKTQTRRPAYRGDIFEADRVLRSNGHARWIMDGRPYTVQPGRGKPGRGEIVICRIVLCPVVGDISDADARAEGFATPADFRAVIAILYGEVALGKPFWALTFRRAD